MIPPSFAHYPWIQGKTPERIAGCEQMPPVISPEYADLLGAETKYVQINSDEGAKRMREGLPLVTQYLGITLKEVEEADVQKLFDATENNTQGVKAFRADELHRHLFTTPGHYPSEIEPEHIWYGYDRFGNRIFIALLGTAISRDPDTAGQILHRFQAIPIEQTRQWDELRPETPGASSLVVMLAAYATRMRELPSLGASKVARDRLLVSAFGAPGIRKHYNELGWMLAEMPDELPERDSDERVKMWWLSAAQERLRHVSSYSVWFGGQKSQTDEEMISALDEMSNGNITIPTSDDSVEEHRLYYEKVYILDVIWQELAYRTKRIKRGGETHVDVKESRARDFFVAQSGEDMLLAVFDGVPIEDVLA